jgi:nitrogen fixation protein NifU and related proteins
MNSSDIYQDEIVTLAKSGTGAARLENPDATVTLDNPLCGDRVTLDVTVADGRITNIGHRVRGCMLCEASAALVARDGIGLGADTVKGAHENLEAVLKSSATPGADDAWSGIAVFAPVAEFKSRHECVLLPFEALARAVDEAGGA